MVHEGIIVLSFAPILASLAFGATWVFVLTSVLAACYDMLFVVMQRYNRPRILRVMEKEKNRTNTCKAYLTYPKKYATLQM